MIRKKIPNTILDPGVMLLKPALTGDKNRGSSLLEVLAAILIITTVLSFISPLLFLVAASRVHGRDVENAINLAQQQIDYVQTEMTRGVDQMEENAILPPPLPSGDIVLAAPAPTTIIAATNNSIIALANRTVITMPEQALRVDADNDGEDDFIIQTFRDEGQRFGNGLIPNQLAIFRMGVRVYSVEAESNLQGGSGESEAASLSFLKGLKERTKQPLAVLFTEVSRSDSRSSQDAYRLYLQ